MSTKNYTVETSNRCRICRSYALDDFLHFDALPVAGIYLREEEIGSEVLLPLTVARCQDCGLVQLRQTITSKIYFEYGSLVPASPGYRDRLQWVAQRMIKNWNVRGKKVIEVGCSDGYLLQELRDGGGDTVFGYEPYAKLSEVWQRKGLEVSSSFFARKALPEYPFVTTDVVLLRHILEHTSDFDELFETITTVLAQDGLLIILAGDAMPMLAEGLYFKLYHENLSYFTPDTLRRLLGQYGYKVLEISAERPPESLFVVCGKAETQLERTEQQRPSAPHLSDWQRFAERMWRYLERLHKFIEDEHQAGYKIAGYGAAHRTINTFSMAGLTSSQVRYLVDKNPYLHGLFTPGAHLPIYPPEYVYEHRPDALVIFATSFETEIVNEQSRFIGEGGRFISLLPEPRYL